MRYFTVESEGDPLAVVVHDYTNGTFYCRSKSEAFRRSFEAVCSKSTIRFSREKESVRAHRRGPFEFEWMEIVLDQLCVGPWKIGKSQNLQNIHDQVDSAIREYLIR